MRVYAGPLPSWSSFHGKQMNNWTNLAPTRILNRTVIVTSYVDIFIVLPSPLLVYAGLLFSAQSHKIFRIRALIDTPSCIASSLIRCISALGILNVNRSLVSFVIYLTSPPVIIISHIIFDVKCLIDIFLFFLYNVSMMSKGGFCMTAKDPYTKDGDTRFTLRIPEDLLSMVKAEAAKNKRSTGKQIEFILEEWVRNNIDEK